MRNFNIGFFVLFIFITLSVTCGSLLYKYDNLNELDSIKGTITDITIVDNHNFYCAKHKVHHEKIISIIPVNKKIYKPICTLRRGDCSYTDNYKIGKTYNFKARPNYLSIYSEDCLKNGEHYTTWPLIVLLIICIIIIIGMLFSYDACLNNK